MSVDIANIFESQATNIKSKKKTVNAKGINKLKEELSVFDSLLKKTKLKTNLQLFPNEETKKNQKIIKNIKSKVEVKITQKSKSIIKTSKDLSDINNKKTIDIPTKKNQKISLLDKMILDLKVSKTLKIPKTIISTAKNDIIDFKNNFIKELIIPKDIKNSETITSKDIKTIKTKYSIEKGKLNQITMEKRFKNSNTKVSKIKSIVEIKDIEPSILLDKIVDDVKEQIKTKKLHSNLEPSLEPNLDNSEKVVLKTVDKVITKIQNTKDNSKKLESKVVESKIIKSKVAEISTTKQVKQIVKNDNKEIISDIIFETKDKLPNCNIKSSITKQAFLVGQVTNPTIDHNSQNVNNYKAVKQDSIIQALMFLSSQKEFDEINKVQIILHSKKILNENKNLKGIKKSADILKLNLTNMEVNHNIKSEVKNIDNSIKTNETISLKENFDNQIKTNSILSKMAFTKNLDISSEYKKEHLQSLEKQIFKYKEDTKDTQNKKVLVKDTIEIFVSNGVSQNIISKIIGARQQIGNFMSTMARKMYLNYKPPLTAFRMNLNPSALGSISVIMKSDKINKSISISMNMSSNTTLEAFIDNKTLLHSALQKNFSENNSNISLNFGMQKGSSNPSFKQTKDGSQNGDRDEVKTTNNIEQIVVNEEVQENTYYM
jgi:hypothetical protein